MLWLVLWCDEASGEVAVKWLCECSEEFPERVATTREPVTERDLQYLTIGIVVNAPYGRRGLAERRGWGVLRLLRWEFGPDCGPQWELLSDGGAAGTLFEPHASEVAADGLYQGEEGGVDESGGEHGQCGRGGIDVRGRVDGGGV